MKKVIIKPGCIGCGLCAFTAPEVFEVNDVSRIKPDADLKKNEELIREAAKGCPVNVIEYEE